MSRGGARGRLADRLGIGKPIISAGMGGVSGPRLAAAVSRAGGLGVLGAYQAVGAGLGELLAQMIGETDGPVAVGLVPEAVSPRVLDDQVATVLTNSPRRVAICSFGPLPASVAARVRTAGRHLITQIGTAADAASAHAYSSALIVQSPAAGGRILSTSTLGAPPAPIEVQELRSRYRQCPMVASGGIASPSASARAADAGADGICCGTAFVATKESDAHPEYCDRVLAAGHSDTVVTDLFDRGWPDRPHRVLANTLTSSTQMRPQALIATTTFAGRRHPVLRYSPAVPTRSTQGAVHEMAMYAGLDVGAVTERRRAAEVVDDLTAAFEEAA